MPLITNPARCDAQLKKIIDSVKARNDFDHKSWSCDELLPVRSFIRGHYRNEQRGACAYCKNPISTQAAGNAHIEHIVPKSLHLAFMFEEKNLCVICADCNEIKKNQETLNELPDTLTLRPDGTKRRQYPRSPGAFFIVHPHFDKWDRHIEKFGHRYIDRTTKGSFTISACKLNRFFHNNFDVDDNYIEDDQLHEMMSQWMDARSSVRRTAVLRELALALSRMNLA